METLGASRISPLPTRDGQRWSVKFVNASSLVFVEILPANSNLLVQVISDTEPPVCSAVLEIGPEGPDLDGINTGLAAQYLYASDLSLAAQNSTPLGMEAK